LDDFYLHGKKLVREGETSARKAWNGQEKSCIVWNFLAQVRATRNLPRKPDKDIIYKYEPICTSISVILF